MSRNDRPEAAQFGSNDAETKTSGTFKGEETTEIRSVDAALDRLDRIRAREDDDDE
jgi:hypothetical protein